MTLCEWPCGSTAWLEPCRQTVTSNPAPLPPGRAGRPSGRRRRCIPADGPHLCPGLPATCEGLPGPSGRRPGAAAHQGPEEEDLRFSCATVMRTIGRTVGAIHEHEKDPDGVPWESLNEDWSRVLRDFRAATRIELGLRALIKARRDRARHSMPGLEAEPLIRRVLRGHRSPAHMPADLPEH
jgi:hypothetical protein